MIAFTEVERLTGGRIGVFDVPCPVCGPGRRDPRNRVRRVLRIWRNDATFASYCCARCPEEGHARPAIDGVPFAPARPTIAAARPQADNGPRALALWSETTSPIGTLAERYLVSRGLSADGIDHAIRFHRGLLLDGVRRPAMVAMFRDMLTNAPVAVHRTFLDDGGRKLERKMLGPAKGAAIKLSPDQDVEGGIGIAEGIETALTIMSSGWRPVWALGSAGAIERFPILPGVSSITVFADHDDAGLAAARACARRWAADGRENRILIPAATGHDWNDA